MPACLRSNNPIFSSPYQGAATAVAAPFLYLSKKVRLHIDFCALMCYHIRSTEERGYCDDRQEY